MDLSKRHRMQGSASLLHVVDWDIPGSSQVYPLTEWVDRSDLTSMGFDINQIVNGLTVMNNGGRALIVNTSTAMPQYPGTYYVLLDVSQVITLSTDFNMIAGMADTVEFTGGNIGVSISRQFGGTVNIQTMDADGTTGLPTPVSHDIVVIEYNNIAKTLRVVANNGSFDHTLDVSSKDTTVERLFARVLLDEVAEVTVSANTDAVQLGDIVLSIDSRPWADIAPGLPSGVQDDYWLRVTVPGTYRGVSYDINDRVCVVDAASGTVEPLRTRVPGGSESNYYEVVQVTVGPGGDYETIFDLNQAFSGCDAAMGIIVLTGNHTASAEMPSLAFPWAFYAAVALNGFTLTGFQNIVGGSFGIGLYGSGRIECPGYQMHFGNHTVINNIGLPSPDYTLDCASLSMRGCSFDLPVTMTADRTDNASYGISVSGQDTYMHSSTFNDMRLTASHGVFSFNGNVTLNSTGKSLNTINMLQSENGGTLSFSQFVTIYAPTDVHYAAGIGRGTIYFAQSPALYGDNIEFSSVIKNTISPHGIIFAPL